MKINPVEILSLAEIAAVLGDLDRKGRRSHHSRQKATIFRLATCCGLRAREIGLLELRDLKLDSDRPHINIRKPVGKGRKSRTVPLWWDIGTCDALRAWKRLRMDAGGRGSDPVVCVLDAMRLAANRFQLIATRSTPGRPLNPKVVARKFKSACKVLGPERQAELHTHSGRHTFGSYMVKDRGLAATRDAMGHASTEITSVYLHVTPEEFDRPGRVFDSVPAEPEPAATP